MMICLRFEELNLECLGIEEKFLGLFLQFGNEIENIKKVSMILVVFLTIYWCYSISNGTE